MFVLKSKYKKLEESLECCKSQVDKYIKLAQKFCPHNRTRIQNGVTLTYFDGTSEGYYTYEICLDCGKIINEGN